MSLRIKAAFLLALSSIPVAGIGRESARSIDCLDVDLIAPRATIELRRAYLSTDKYFVGVFELVNYEFKPGLQIHLARWPGHVYFDSLSTILEFKDLNDSWVKLDDGRLPGTFVMDPADLKTVKPGERLVFQLRLFRREILKRGGREFRLKLYPESDAACQVSFPFQAVSPLPLPTVPRSVPHPKVLRTVKPSARPPSCLRRPMLNKCHKSKFPLPSSVGL